MQLPVAGTTIQIARILFADGFRQPRWHRRDLSNALTKPSSKDETSRTGFGRFKRPHHTSLLSVPWTKRLHCTARIVP
jgi:hypothetical protein